MDAEMAAAISSAAKEAIEELSKVPPEMAAAVEEAKEARDRSASPSDDAPVTFGEAVAIDRSHLKSPQQPGAPEPDTSHKSLLTPMGRELKQRIELAGPISVDAFMREALTSPQFGEKQLGARGDFITAPEASQMFGELCGVWMVDQWAKQGQQPTRIVELGPGEGTLMVDAVRAASKFKGFMENVEIHFVEVSRHMRQRQQYQLERACKGLSDPPSLHWHERIEDVPDDKCSVYYRYRASAQRLQFGDV